jgi:hypothetical protein
MRNRIHRLLLLFGTLVVGLPCFAQSRELLQPFRISISHLTLNKS